MTSAGWAFAPLGSWWLVALIVTALGLGAGVAWRRGGARRAGPRLALAVAATLVLAGPARRVEERVAARDVAVALVDRSGSMAVNRGKEMAAAALARLRAAAPGVEWRVAEVRGLPGGGTLVAPALTRALGRVPPERLAGVVLLTDGVVGAPPAAAIPAGAPVHVLVAGRRGLVDRRLVLTRVPPFAAAGARAWVGVRVDDGPEAVGGEARIDWTVDGVAQPSVIAAPGVESRLELPPARRGVAEVVAEVAALPGEATRINNAVIARVRGVPGRLRVLLVSGAPSPGGRAWRDTLKGDDSVDLVHFTILRLPTSFDPTPSEAMALIPFPTEELFARRLSTFDLIVFDRFGLSELIEPRHLNAVAARVREGGALLVAAGAEYAAPGGLAETALAGVLPVRPAGGSVDVAVVPVVTARGRRHPITAPFAAGQWGPWEGRAGVMALGGAEVLLADADGAPLLVVGRAGRGRAGVVASTGSWWWSRGIQGGGPREALMARLAAWLMREPALEEAALEARMAGRALTIAARGAPPPGVARVAGPDARDVPLTAGTDGVVRATVSLASDGLHRVTAGGLSRAVLAGEAVELAEVRPRAEPLAALARATGGGVFWLEEGVPDVRRVAPGARGAGGDWLGLRRNAGGALVALRVERVIPSPVAWVVLAGLAGLAWWREARVG